MEVHGPHMGGGGGGDGGFELGQLARQPPHQGVTVAVGSHGNIHGQEGG